MIIRIPPTALVDDREVVDGEPDHCTTAEFWAANEEGFDADERAAIEAAWADGCAVALGGGAAESFIVGPADANAIVTRSGHRWTGEGVRALGFGQH